MSAKQKIKVTSRISFTAYFYSLKGQCHGIFDLYWSKLLLFTKYYYNTKRKNHQLLKEYVISRSTPRVFTR